jgi:hypothetical protein
MTIQQFREMLVFLEEFNQLDNANSFHARYKIFIDTLSLEDKTTALNALLDLTYQNLKKISQDIDFQELNTNDKQLLLQEVETQIQHLDHYAKVA